MIKSARHALILDIIDQNDIETQTDLADALKERGVNVTQATVSRDIKELRLLKVLSDGNTYKYATVDKAERGLTERFIRIFSESVVSIKSSANLIVVKTLSGSAHVAGEAVDALHWPEIIGTIAGDNTILVIASSIDAVEDIIQRFNKMLK